MIEWQPIETAPRGVPIVVKIGDWVGTVRLNVVDKDDQTTWISGDAVIHYNGDVLVDGFRGVYDGWISPKSFKRAPRQHQP